VKGEQEKMTRSNITAVNNQAIVDAMNATGLTVADISRKTGVNYPTLLSVRAFRQFHLAPATLTKLATALGVDVEALKAK